MVTRFRRREGHKASMNFERFVNDPMLGRWEEFERRLHGFDVAIIAGLVIAVLGVPAIFLMLWFLRT